MLSLNKSVELFRYTTSDKDELRAKFNESLLRRSGPGEFGTGDDASLSFTNLLARAISEALDTLLDPASEEDFVQKPLRILMPDFCRRLGFLQRNWRGKQP